MSINIEDNKKLLEEALKGERGPDQTLIAEIGLEFLTTILRKNMDYGSSVFKPPILNPTLPAKSAIEVRLSDKITRFQQLKKAEANVKTESIQDTMRDFGAYGILWLIADEKERQEKVTESEVKSTVSWKVHPAIAYPGVLSEKIKVTIPDTGITFRESNTPTPETNLEKNEKYRKLYDVKVQDHEGSIFQRCPNGIDFESIQGTARFHPERLQKLGYIMNRINEHEYILVKAVSSSNTDKNLDGLVGNRFEKLSNNRWGCIGTHSVIEDESLGTDYLMTKDEQTGTYILCKNTTPETKLDIDKYLGQPLTYFPHSKALFTLDNTKIPLSEIDHNKYIYQTTEASGNNVFVTLSKISD